jgi:predicted RND superfamily exporter protein
MNTPDRAPRGASGPSLSGPLGIPLRRPRLTLAVMAVLTLVFGVFAARITVDSAIENLMATDDPERRYQSEAAAVFGDEELSVIGVFADDVFTPSTIARIADLSRQVAALDGVREVLSLTTVKGLESSDEGVAFRPLVRELPRTADEAAALRRRVLAEPLYLKNVVAPDGRAAGISILYDPMTDHEFRARGLDGQIRALVAEMGGPERFVVTGRPNIKVAGARLMEWDVARFTSLSLLLVVAMLAAIFRTVRGVLVPLSTVIIAVVWTTGIMVLAGSAINMGTLVLSPLLMVIGIASGIHLLSQYYLEARPGREAREVVAATVEHVRAPVVVAALTTLVGFGALILTPMQAIRDFGVYAVVGIGVVLLAVFSVVPAALVLLRVPAPAPATEEEPPWLTRQLRTIGLFAIRHRRAVLAASVLVCLASVWGISRVRVETDYLGFFSPDSDIRQEGKAIADGLAGTQPIYIVLDGNGPNTVTRLETLEGLRALQEFIDGQHGVDKTMSLLDYLRLVRGALRPEERGTLPASQAEIEQFLLLVDPDQTRSLVNDDRSRANLIVRSRLTRSVDVRAFVDRVKEFAATRFPADVSVHPTGTAVLLALSADALVWGTVLGLWQELAVLLALLSILFLSVRAGIIALIPNVVPTILLFGLMGWTGISLNVSTCMIAAIAIGIAIDDTIHLLTTFNAGLRETGSQEQAILRALSTVGQAAVFIAATLAAGFLIVTLSSFQPVRHFGMLSAATMGIALAVELFLTPALLTTTKLITLWDMLYVKLGSEPQKQVPLFAGLREFQAKIVTLMARLAATPAGQLIATRGEVRPEMYVLLEGRAAVERPDGRGRLRMVGRGDVVGEMGLVRAQARSADVVALEDTEYLVVDERFLQRLRRRYPRIAATVFFNLTRILSDRLERTTDDLAGPTREPPAAAPAALTGGSR